MRGTPIPFARKCSMNRCSSMQAFGIADGASMALDEDFFTAVLTTLAAENGRGLADKNLERFAGIREGFQKSAHFARASSGGQSGSTSVPSSP